MKTNSGTWLSISEGAQVGYRVEPDGRYADFHFHGPMELEIGMPAELVRRCRDLFRDAVAEMDRAGRNDVR
ncbi:hypothetical protein CFN78_22390 [Amycolatopsis antarctica]|uniref:Uncharacterized protein n=2 Tax=Amycolatopsis antarctica TaxID=1854586 RepID=A0A263CXN9_9PSEU|nr:hypothetical protein CFN78_22390 [Amycolatopsis antarctica]